MTTLGFTLPTTQKFPPPHAPYSSDLALFNYYRLLNLRNIWEDKRLRHR